MRARVNNKVLLFVGHDLIGLMLTNDLVRKMKELECTPVIVNTRSIRNRRPTVPAPAEPSFYGAEIVDKVLLPHLDQNDTAYTDCAYLSYKKLARRYDVEYTEVDDVNDKTFLKKVEDDPTIIGGLALRLLQVFDPNAISTFEKKGFLWNLHGGMLPRYKGLLIPYRAIENNERTYGWTLHKMAPKIDSGDIIDTTEKPLNRLRPVFKIYADMIPFGVTMIASTLESFLETNTYQFNPQTPIADEQDYYPYPTTEEMDKYRRAGIQYVGDIDSYVRCIVQKFSNPSSREGSDLQKSLAEAAIAWQQGIRQKETQEMPQGLQPIRPALAA